MPDKIYLEIHFFHPRWQWPRAWRSWDGAWLELPIGLAFHVNAKFYP